MHSYFNDETFTENQEPSSNVSNEEVLPFANSSEILEMI